MFRELKIFFTAIMFYTRIPVPKSTGFSEENLNKATRYFTLIGIIVGGIGALLFFGSTLVLSAHLSILIALTGMILATGAFHEDALSDFCDGFGGGYTKAKRLEIMKDSRIGTYGALALVLLILSKLFLLSEFDPELIPVIFIVAHAISRVNPILLIFTSEYVRMENGKSKPIGTKSSAFTLIAGLFFGLIPLLLITLRIVPFVLGALALIFISFRYYVKNRIGGYTGDVLGALQQFSELGFYLAYLIADKFV